MRCGASCTATEPVDAVMRRTLADLMQQPGRVLGTWTQFTDPDVIDLLGAAGFDFTIIDCEHGAFGIETTVHLVRACEAAGVAPLVRVPHGDTTMAYKALDAGAAGILSPGIASADEARRMVDATRFAPQGTRGACPIVRAASHSARAWPAVVQQQAGVGVIAMIETRDGVAQARAICATPGLAALMVGPFDLSVSLGHGGDLTAPELGTAIDTLLAAAHAAGIAVWMPVFAPEQTALQSQLDHWSARGVRHFAVGADKIVVAAALARYRSWAANAGSKGTGACATLGA